MMLVKLAWLMNNLNFQIFEFFDEALLLRLMPDLFFSTFRLRPVIKEQAN